MNSKIALLTVASIGTAGGVGGLGYWYSIPKDLKEVLTQEGKKLLDVYGDTNDSDWKKLAQKYPSSGETITLSDNTQVTKINGFNITTTGNNSETFKQLKEQCKKLFETKKSEESSFERAKQDAINWCVQDSNTLTKELKTSSTSIDSVAGRTGSSSSQSQSVTQGPSGGGTSQASPSNINPSSGSTVTLTG